MSKKRLDVLVVERGLAETRSKAQRVVRAGQILVDGLVSDKPGARIPPSAELTLVQGPRFVSRGGEKLEAALSAFSIDVADRVAADVGASTGGFTDCLLQRGAARVFAIDVGYGQLDWSLRKDPRVIVMERTNARYLEALPEPVDLVTIDVSFISLALILPRAADWLRHGMLAEPRNRGNGAHAARNKHVIALVKPQFEAGRRDVGKGGVVRDPAVHRAVLERVAAVAGPLGFGLRGLIASPIRGAAGNIEFLAWWGIGPPLIDARQAIRACVPEDAAE